MKAPLPIDEANSLHASEIRYRRLFEAARDGILILDATTGQIEDANPFLCELVGYTVDELLGKHLWDIGSFRDITANKQAFDVLQQQGYIRYDHLPLRKKGGESVFVEFVSNVYDEEGLQVIQCNIRDIGERRHHEEALRIGQERFEILSRATNDAIWDWNLLNDVIWWNVGFQTLFGYKEADIEPGIESWKGRIHPDDFQRVSDGIHAIIDSGQQAWSDEYRFRRVDGTYASIFDRGFIIRDDNQRPIRMIGSMLDVTEHKEAEAEKARLLAEIEQQRQRANNIVANIPGMVWESWGRPGESPHATDFVSEYVTTMLGYSVEEWLATPNFWLNIVHPEDKDRALREGATIFAGGQGGITQYRWMAKDGRAVWVEGRIAVILDENGKSVGMRGVSLDITDRKMAEAALRQAHDELEMRVNQRTKELEKVNESLRIENLEHQATMERLRKVANALQHAKEEADKANMAKSEFLSRMSHELRTPLNAILGFGQILEMQGLESHPKECVGYILKGGQHLLDLINEVLDISRVETGNFELSLEPIALDEVVPLVCAMVKPLAAERNIRVIQKVSQQGRNYILADRQRLQQVILNLLANAIKYNRDSGDVEVVCTQPLEGWMSIAIHDTGPGISPEDLPKLFTPFERLNAANSDIEGTGLGLVLSQRLVKAMNGTLKIESVVGQGTTLTIELPQAYSRGAMLSATPETLLQDEANIHTEQQFCVLYIEDNVSNLKLMESIFEIRPDWGLLSASAGEIGLDMARQLEPDLIMLDLNLPGIQGPEVLIRLRQSPITRDIPVVVVSADATPNQVERMLAAGASGYLTKPLNVGQVLHTLDKFLQPMLEM